MSRPIPEILIADDSAAQRSFAIIKTQNQLTLYEILDDDDVELSGTTVVMPRDNGDLLLLEAWNRDQISTDELLADASRIADALEENDFRTMKRLESEAENDDYE